VSRFEKLEISIKPKPLSEKADKEYDEAYYLELARETQLNGDFETALKYYSRALSYKTDIPDAWIGQVLCLIDLAEFKEAIVWADRAAEVIGTIPELLAVKALALGRSGDMDRAIAFSDQSMKKGDNKPILWLCRGDLLAGQDPRNANFCFKKAVEADPDIPFVNLRIGVSLMSVDEVSAALAYLKKALLGQPQNAFILFLIGNCYHRIGMPDNARDYYKKALKINPEYKECVTAQRRLRRLGFFRTFSNWLRNLFRNREV
jgi:tetratricopeptide (TPR) repeat protein